MRLRNLIMFGIGLTAMALFATTLARAQGPNVDDQVNRISKGLYCPVCPNTPLDVCQTQACVQWRALIKEKLLKGESEQQIVDYFVAQYGNQVLGAPPPQGFNWLAYILPGAGILVGASIAWLTVRRWLSRTGGYREHVETPAIPKEYADRVEQELKED